jgi:FkbM family methyltransferase
VVTKTLIAPSRRSGTRVALERLWLRALPHVTGDYSWAAVGGFRMYGSAAHQRYLGRLGTGRVERFTVRLFREAIRPGMVVADVGAYLGYFTLVAARELNGAGTVFSFECHPANHRFLLHNIRLNGLADLVVPSSSAVANEMGRLPFRAQGGDLSTGSLLGTHSHQEALEVPATTLDQALGGRRLDVMKMDIEGGEVRALDGMEGTLAASAALVLLVECNPSGLRAAGASAAELLDRLESAAFSVSQIDEKAKTLRPVGEKLRAGQGEDDRKFHVNLYCTRGAA